MTPDQYTNQELFIEVGDGHDLYVQDWGNKAIKTPVIFLHGGPGNGCNDGHRSRFDPLQQRVIFFDQRGCGRSIPYGSLEHNTTADLVADITKIADKLGLKQFILHGGSWGSTLALAYALEHPKRVKAMVLQGIFTGSQSEIDYLDQGLFRTFYPDVWDRYLQATPAEHRKDPGVYHVPRILGSDEQAVRQSGFAYSFVEYSILHLDDRPKQGDPETFDPTETRIEVHYMHNRCFMPDRHILKNAHKLTMPVWLVQGRYDMVCPPATAYELNQKLPNSELIWTVAGHANDRANYDACRTILLALTK